jgi:citrate synthase
MEADAFRNHDKTGILGRGCFQACHCTSQHADNVSAMAEETLTITDNRTGRRYEVPIRDGSIAATDLQKISSDGAGSGLLSYDPAFLNTASCRSAITFIDGERGILRYRGYPVEELAERSSFLEVAYLLIHGELPDPTQHQHWVDAITHHTLLHENIKKLIDGFHHDAHPMGILVGTVGALSTFYPDAKDIFNEESRRLQILRLIAKMPTLAAFAARHAVGMPYAYPDNDLSYAGNFLNMMWKATELKYEPNPVLERALDVLLILHADHEQNCSTNVMRAVGSSHADPFSATAAAAAALYGPLHGGANEQVLRMLKEIGSIGRVPEYVKRVRSGELRMMGFGHRVYKNFDPRAQIIKKLAHDVLAVTGRSPLLDIALEMERVALADDYFIKHRLYPNVDFYSGIIYLAIGFPVEMFPVLFAIGRTPGWLAQWQEGLLDPEQKIMRPRQLYTGAAERHVPGVRAATAGAGTSGG